MTMHFGKIKQAMFSISKHYCNNSIFLSSSYGMVLPHNIVTLSYRPMSVISSSISQNKGIKKRSSVVDNDDASGKKNRSLKKMGMTIDKTKKKIPSNSSYDGKNPDDQEEKEIRLSKMLSMSGVASRREAEKLILSGSVMVNGKKRVDLSTKVNVHKDQVEYDGKILEIPKKTRIWIANKLKGELVTTSDPKGRQTIMDRLRKMGVEEKLIAVGRLDYNTEGLLLFTNNGDLARSLEHPKNAVRRVYRTLVYGIVNPVRLESLKKGITIDKIRYRPIYVNIASSCERDVKKPKKNESSQTDKKQNNPEKSERTLTWLTVSIEEGKNREVKKVMSHIGLIVNRLIRTQYGPYRLADLPQGALLEVSPKMKLAKV